MPAKGLPRDESPGRPPHRRAGPQSHDPERGARRDDGRAGRDRRVRHRRLGLHGRARPLPRRRHPLRSHRARAGRRAHGGRLRARQRPTRRLHRPERAGHHQLRHRDRRGLLGAQPGGRDHARDGQHDAGARRLPGDRAARDLLEDHEVPGAPEQPEADGRTRGPRLRPRRARDGTGAAQHPARLLLRRTRLRDRRADPDRARPRRFEQPRRSRRSCSPARASR